MKTKSSMLHHVSVMYQISWEMETPCTIFLQMTNTEHWTRVHKSLVLYTRVHKSLVLYTRVHTSLVLYTRVHKSLVLYTRVHKSLVLYTRVHKSLVLYTRVLIMAWELSRYHINKMRETETITLMYMYMQWMYFLSTCTSKSYYF